MAKYLYPALFKKEGTRYFVSFPDFNSCFSDGDSLQEAYDMAGDILAAVLCFLEDEQYEIPRASELPSIKPGENEFTSLIGCDTTSYRMEYDDKPVKRTVTLPAHLCWKAERANLDLSVLLLSAIKRRLQTGRRSHPANQA